MDEGYQRLNPKAEVSMYIGHLIIGLIVSAMVFPAAYFMSGDESVPGIVPPVMYAAGVMVWVYLLLSPYIYYRRYKYIITDDKIDVRRGVIILRHIVIPIERIHQVEVTRGPINNLFGLADITITTAGGNAVIEYLDSDVADDIADRLNAIVNQILKGRKEDA